MNYIVLNNNNDLIAKSITKLYPGASDSSLDLYVFANYDTDNTSPYTVKLLFKRQDGFVIGDCITSEATATNPVNNTSMRVRKFSFNGTQVLNIPGELQITIKYIKSNGDTKVAFCTARINYAPKASEIASIETNATNISELDTKIDTEVDNFTSGTKVAKKAEQDSEGNVIKDYYIAKETGKGLSSNDYDNTEKGKVSSNTSARHIHSNSSILNATEESFTTLLKGKLDNIESGSQVNILDGVQIGGTDVIASSKKVNITKELIDTLIGLATTSANGLLSKEDKASLDAVVEVFASDSDDDTIINKIQEVLNAFENYPEGTDLLSKFTALETSLKTYVGSLTDLTTTSKTSIVSALNEIKSSLSNFTANKAIKTANIDDGAVTNDKLDSSLQTTITNANSIDNTVKECDKRLKNIEKFNELTNINNIICTEDNSPKRFKNIPIKALPYVKCNKIGGLTTLVNNVLVDNKITSVKSVGPNKWDEQWEIGSLNSNGAFSASNDMIRSKNYINILPSTSYYFCSSYTLVICFYTIDKTYISTVEKSNTSYTTPDNAYFIRFRMASNYGTTYNNDIQICLNSYDEKTTYHKYECKNTAIPSYITGTDGYGVGLSNSLYNYIDSENKLHIFVKKIKLKDLTWSYSPSDDVFSSVVSDKANEPYNNEMLCDGYTEKDAPISSLATKQFRGSSGNNYVYFKDTDYNDTTDFHNHFTDDEYLYYKLAIPIEITLSKIDSFYEIISGGTLELVNVNNVDVPNELIFFNTNLNLVNDNYTNIIDPNTCVLNKRLNSSGTLSDLNGSFVTDFIPFDASSNPNPSYLRRLGFDMESDTANGIYCYVSYYNASKEHLGYTRGTDAWDEINKKIQIGLDNNVQVLSTYLDIRYIRISSAINYTNTALTSKTELYNCIGTINEEIPIASYHKETPNFVVKEVNRLVEVVRGHQNKNTISFIAMSDNHLDAIEQSIISANDCLSAVKLLNDKIHIDFGIHCGDYTYGFIETPLDRGVQEIKYIIDGFIKGMNGKPVLLTTGNHDALVDAKSINDNDYLTRDELFKFIGIHNYGAIMPSKSVREKGYCYRDFEAQQVRVICLNTCDSDGSSATYNYSMGDISAAQMQWFANSLDLSTKSDASDWSIIIFSHHPLDWGRLIPAVNVINAYNTGASLSMTVDGTSITYDYANKNSAKIACQIHGHCHNYKYDYLHTGVVNTTSPVAISTYRVGVPNASFRRNNTYGFPDSSNENNGIDFGCSNTTEYEKATTKVANTKNSTAFIVFTIDTVTNKIYADHYGAGFDREIDY